ncbi:MAG: hypothetical protein WCS43_12325 [Verrucomicrobiota bacterium]
MNSNPSLPDAKKARALAIATTIHTVCRHFEVDPAHVLTSHTKKKHPDHNARRIIYHHLHSCGMHKMQIARIFGRSQTSVHDGLRYAHFNLIDRHRLLLEKLPKIPEKP